MKTSNPRLLVVMILPVALLSNRCAINGGTPPRSDTAVTGTSQPLVRKAPRPAAADPRVVAADSRMAGQRGGRIATGGARVIELKPVLVNDFSALPDGRNHGSILLPPVFPGDPVYIGDDPRWIHEMGRSSQQRSRPSVPDASPLAAPHGDGY